MKKSVYKFVIIDNNMEVVFSYNKFFAKVEGVLAAIIEECECKKSVGYEVKDYSLHPWVSVKDGSQWATAKIINTATYANEFQIRTDHLGYIEYELI